MEHKIILGGEIYLPFARSRIKVLRATGLKYVSQSFEMGDASVKVRIAGEHEYITLLGSSPGYQFFTTGPTIGTQAIGFGLVIYNGYACKTNRKGVAAALASSVETSAPGAAKSWSFASPSADITRYFPRKNLWQIEGISQHAYYPKTQNKLNSKQLLISSWGCADPLQTLTILGGKPLNRSRFDVTYDSAPCLFADSARTPQGFNGLAPDADWYKQAAVRTVTHPDYGSRTFIVMADVFGTFHVYPVGQVDDTLLKVADAAYPGQAIKTNVPEKFVKRRVVPWPLWCRYPTVAARDFYTGTNDYELLRRVPQYKWAFNSTATRACSVVFEDMNALPLNDPAATVPYREDDGVRRPLQESLPGLLELDIEVKITGKLPEEFTFTLTVKQSLQPSVTQRYVMMADYAWDVPNPINKDAPYAVLDDLLLLEGGIYHTSDVRISATQGLNIDARKSLVLVKNETLSTTVRTFVTFATNQLYAYDNLPAGPASLPLEEQPLNQAVGILLAADLRTLSFVVQQRFTQTTLVVQSSASELKQQTSQKLQTYVKNALFTKTLAGSAFQSDLTALHENFSIAGLFKYPLDDVGTFPPLFSSDYSQRKSVYASFDILFQKILPSYYQNTSALMLTHGGAFQAGAYLYGARMATALQLNPKDHFAVSPDGSWSLALTPVYCYTGEVFLGRDPLTWLDLSLIKQETVDVVVFKSKKPDEPDIQKTHLELFTKAFDKSLSTTNFSCEFSLQTDQLDWADASDQADGKSIRYYLKAKTPSGAELFTYLGGYSVRLTPTGVDSGPRFYDRPSQSLAEADARVIADFVFSVRPMMTGFNGSLLSNSSGQRVYTLNLTSPEFSPLSDHTAVLNGSTLFY